LEYNLIGIPIAAGALFPGAGLRLPLWIVDLFRGLHGCLFSQCGSELSLIDELHKAQETGKSRK